MDKLWIKYNIGSATRTNFSKYVYDDVITSYYFYYFLFIHLTIFKCD